MKWGNIPGENFVGWNFPEGKLMGGNFSGWNFPQGAGNFP